MQRGRFESLSKYCSAEDETSNRWTTTSLLFEGERGVTIQHTRGIPLTRVPPSDEGA